MTFNGAPYATDIKQHALDEFPRECCGIVKAAEYVPITNVDADPTNGFTLSRDEMALHDSDEILAIVHSHTVRDPREMLIVGNTPDCPSHADMVAQKSWNIPWGIVVTDGTNARDPFYWGDGADLTDPLVGRIFRHGVFDCYSIIRGWYWQNKGVVLEDHPRGDNWWKNGGDLYLENYFNTGFVSTSFNKVQVGDVLLFQVLSKTVNHAGVYIGNNLFVHHPNASNSLTTRTTRSLSREEPVTRWINVLTNTLSWRW